LPESRQRKEVKNRRKSKVNLLNSKKSNVMRKFGATEQEKGHGGPRGDGGKGRGERITGTKSRGKDAEWIKTSRVALERRQRRKRGY